MAKNCVLIADDSQSSRKVMRGMFDRSYEIFEAGNGREALALMNKYKDTLAIVVLDLIMPLVSGLDVLKVIQDNEGLKVIPIIVVTGDNKKETEIEALKLGAWDVITKPYDSTIVRHRLKNAINIRIAADIRTENILLMEKEIREAKANAEIRFHAEHDETTGVYNHRKFCEATTKLLNDNPSISYVLTRSCIKQFHTISGMLGSDATNKILTKVADTLKKSVPSGAIFGRLEGDHFAACFPVEKLDIEELSKRFICKVSDVAEEYTINITLGIYVIASRDITVDEMCSRANLALQSIQNHDIKNYAYYDDSMHEKLLREQRIETQMNDALLGEQFKVYLQPVYSLSQGKTVSAEALVRWIHPESGIIAPNNFIPLFEKNGFITKLDFYMMDKTCQFLSNRRKEGKMPIPVSVNLSRRSIYSRDITGDLTGLMEKYDLSPSELKLEITETAYTDNPEQLKKTVIELQKRGFIILMDDFGSGYSSLNMLKDLPVDILKIDMKFLENFDVSSRAGNIVTSVVRMAKWLKLPVIAEGVETRQQVNFLSSLGCDMIQGYYFSRPITIEDFEKFVLNDGCASGEAAVPKLQQSDVDMIFGGNQFVSQIMSSAFGALGFYELNGTKLEAIRVNDGYYKIYGMNPKSFSEMADNALKHVHPDDVEKMLKACNQSIITNKTQRLIIRAFHNDGHLLWIDLIARFVGGSENHPLLCIAFEDITQKKQAENDLATSEEMMRAALIHANLYSWNYNVQDGSAVVGYLSQRDLLLPEKMDDYVSEIFKAGIISDPYKEPFLAMHRDLKNGAKEASCVVKLLLPKKKTLVWVKMQYTNIFDENGIPVKAIGTAGLYDEYMELEDRFTAVLIQNGIITWEYSIKNKSINNISRSIANNGLPNIIEHVPESIIATGNIHVENIQDLCNMFNDINKGEKSGDCVYRWYSKKADRWLWYKINYTTIFNRFGKPEKAIGSGIDVTDHYDAVNRYEEFYALNKFSKADYASAYIINLTKNVVEVKETDEKTKEKLEKLTADDFLLSNCKNVIGDEYKKKYKLIFTRGTLVDNFHKGIMQNEITVPYYGSENKLQWYQFTAKLMKNPVTSDIICFAFSKNVNNEKIKSLIHTEVVTDFCDCVAYLEPNDDYYELVTYKENLKFLPKNHGTFSVEIEKYINEFVPSDDRKLIKEQHNLKNILNNLKSSDSYSFRFNVMSENSLITKETTVSYIDKPTSLICIMVRDITETIARERKKNEELSSALREVEKANNAKAEFLARMSHDLRTPMNSIIGLTELAWDSIENPEEMKSSLHQIDNSAKFLLTLINDILDMTAIQTQKIILRPENVNLKEFYEDVFAAVEPIIKEKQLEFNYNIKSSNLEYAKFDKHRLMQIVVNLISISAKFSELHGKIFCDVQSIPTSDNRLLVKLLVNDTGSGISTEFLSKVFLPFEQEYVKDNENFQGTGLGLAIVKNIVELMGGRISAASKNGVGTSFSAFFYIEYSDGVENGEKSRKTGDTFQVLNGKCVLLAEDHMLNAKIMFNLLEKQKMKVFHAKNGAEAVAMFEQSESGFFDAVLMDIRMPQMDGLTAAFKIRALNRSDAATVPIIAMTANAFDEDIQRSLESGMNDHLSKPIEAKKLWSTLSRYIGR